MESLYSKLYDKYTKLKTKKEAEIEKVSRDQEERFMAYMSAADELVEHLKSENEKLRGQVNDLRSEAASIRITKDQEHAEHQKLLIEEKHKYREALKEIERLKVAEQEDKTRSGSKRKKRFRDSRDSPVTNPEIKHNYHLSSNGELSKENLGQPNCCRMKKIPGEGYGDTICTFQELAECIIGMKLTINTETDEELCMLFVHQSSGFSFSLTWRREGWWWSGEGEEVIYKVVTLGTFEKVAPPWTRQIMIFSNNMFPLFFQRIYRVINTFFRQS